MGAAVPPLSLSLSTPPPPPGRRSTVCRLSTAATGWLCWFVLQATLERLWRTMEAALLDCWVLFWRALRRAVDSVFSLSVAVSRVARRVVSCRCVVSLSVSRRACDTD